MTSLRAALRAASGRPGRGSARRTPGGSDGGEVAMADGRSAEGGSDPGPEGHQASTPDQGTEPFVGEQM